MKPTLLSLLVLVVVMSAAHAESYLIQPGDTLSIIVLGEQDLTKRTVVDPRGSITLPLAKEVLVAGLEPAQAAEQIAKQLKRYIKSPQVSVELIEAAKMQISVSGEVKAPGIYSIARGGRLMDAITAAGGYTPTADMSRVTVSHAGNTTLVDVTKFLISGDTSANVAVSGSDTIVVPGKDTATIGSVSVLGAVQKSGQYPITRGMTLREAIMLAGGPTESADLTKIMFRRENTPEASVDYLKAASGDPTANIELKPGDVIYISPRVGLGFFNIQGAVGTPGRYQIKDKTSLTEAIALAGGMTSDAKTDNVRILRTSTGKSQSMVVNVKSIYDGHSENVLINDNDNIYVSVKKKRPELLQLISAAVSLGWLLTR